ncbi:DUF4360 domain-containing protein [Actinomadura meridiana]|uniref:DUF4360 domain-containing protein n=1 Tax=Actinomadura meridiana TaxID=559626 RepID=A0ABP8C3Z9_9ACTN
MRKGIAISGAAAALATTVVSVTPAAASVEYLQRGPDGVTIEVATVNGSGCPIGSTAIALSPDNDAFTITYSKYLAQVGGNSQPTDDRKNCQINLRVHVPQGFTYAVSSTDYRGFASLQTGVTGTLAASYYFQGYPGTRHYSYDWPGPLRKNWQQSDLVPVQQLVFKECGEERLFNVNTELRLDPGESDPAKVSYMSMDSTDGSIKTTYHYTWKTCP